MTRRMKVWPKRGDYSYGWHRHPVERLVEILRKIKGFWQRGRRGYADCDVADLDQYILSWLPGALRHMRDTTVSFPSDLSKEEWHKILTEMADRLAVGTLEYYYCMVGSDKRDEKSIEKEFEEGMRLFCLWFRDLWD